MAMMKISASFPPGMDAPVTGRDIDLHPKTTQHDMSGNELHMNDLLKGPTSVLSGLGLQARHSNQSATVTQLL